MNGTLDLQDWNDFMLRLASVTDNGAAFTGGTGVNYIPVNYSQFNAGALPTMTSTATISYATGFSIFGLASLKVVGPGTTYFASSSATYPFPIAPNQNWILSVYTKAGIAGATGTLGIKTAAGTYSSGFTTHGVAGDILRVSVVLNLTADASTLFDVVLTTTDAGGVSIWFDGFMLEPQSGTTTYPSPYSVNTPSTILNANPPGGVVNNLPYVNHSAQVTAALQSTADSNGSYLTHGTVWDAHIGSVKVDTLTDATYKRVIGTDVGAGNQLNLEIAGSGIQLGDQRNIPSVNAANARSLWQSGLTVTGSYSSVTTKQSISASSGVLQVGATTVSYGTPAAITGLPNTATTYYLYYTDQGFAGGTLTMNDATSTTTLVGANGNVFLGQVTLVVSGSSNGNTGGGGHQPV